MANYTLFQTGTGGAPQSGPATATNYSGAFIAALLFTVARGMWLEGFYIWCCAAGGQPTAPCKAALWNLTNTASGVLLTSTTSGALTPGAWNYIPLAAPFQLATGGTYIAQVAVNGSFPDTNNFWGPGDPYQNGLASGPLFAFGSGPNAAPTWWPAGPSTWYYSGSASTNDTNGPFSTAGSDPTTTGPVAGTDGSFDNFWVDVLVSDSPPVGYSDYRIWPNNPDAWQSASDTAACYNVATEFSISVASKVQKIWMFSPTGATGFPDSAAVWTVTGGGLSGTAVFNVAAPAWKNPDGSAATAGSRSWVYCDVSALAVTLPAGDYKVAVATSTNTATTAKSPGYFISGGPGQSGITNGPITVPSTATGSEAYNYNSGDPGSTPPFTDGTTAANAQATFSQNPATGNPATYPSLYAPAAPGQSYWVDIELTPPPVVPWVAGDLGDDDDDGFWSARWPR